MVKIIELNKSKLLQFIHSDEYNKLTNLPISKHRALSQINNPRVEDNQSLLFLAYYNDELAGYLGTVPDKIKLTKNESYGWFSCIWVNPILRGKKIALKLVQKSLKAYNNKIIITEFTDSAEKLYNKTNCFKKLENKKGIRLYIRSDLQTILPPKKNIFKRIKPFLQFFDDSLNILIDLKLKLYKKEIHNLEFDYVSIIDEEISDFINIHQQKELFKRNRNDLNWIIKNPWILSSKKKTNESEKYYFSSIDKLFKFTPVKIFNSDKKLVAFFIFQQRNNHLKLIYHYTINDLTTTVKIINHHIIKWKASTFTTYNAKLSEALKNQHSPAIYKKPVERKYIITEEFNKSQENIEFEIQDGDGDCSFT